MSPSDQLDAEVAQRLDLLDNLTAAKDAEAIVALFSDARSTPTSRARNADEILAALWVGPVPLEWWGTPLGLLLAQHATDRPLSQRDVAQALGLAAGTIAQLVHRGRIERYPGTSQVSLRSAALWAAARSAS